MPVFDYTSGSPDNLTGGAPARMQDIQGPFYDIRAWLNSTSGGGGSGSTVPVLTSAPVLDVGMVGQVRAGRQLANADFTSLGLSVPLGLWNLSDLLDVSGNGRVLSNKGSVPFGVGINGLATTSAVFSGSTGQALYIADTGGVFGSKPARGDAGLGRRNAATQQFLLSKHGTSGAYGWVLGVGGANATYALASLTGSDALVIPGVSDVADDRWHFAVATCDGTTGRVYVDGVLEGTLAVSGAIFSTAAPLNVGSGGADAANNAGGTPGGAANIASYGRVDEAFVTNDILTEDQIRCLYATRLTHTLTTIPALVSLERPPPPQRRRIGGRGLPRATIAAAQLHGRGAHGRGVERADAHERLHVADRAGGRRGRRRRTPGTSGNAFRFGGAARIDRDGRGATGRAGDTLVRVLVQDDQRRTGAGIIGVGRDQRRARQSLDCQTGGLSSPSAPPTPSPARSSPTANGTMPSW